MILAGIPCAPFLTEYVLNCGGRGRKGEVRASAVTAGVGVGVVCAMAYCWQATPTTVVSNSGRRGIPIFLCVFIMCSMFLVPHRLSRGEVCIQTIKQEWCQGFSCSISYN